MFLITFAIFPAILILESRSELARQRQASSELQIQELAPGGYKLLDLKPTLGNGNPYHYQERFALLIMVKNLR